MTRILALFFLLVIIGSVHAGYYPAGFVDPRTLPANETHLNFTAGIQTTQPMPTIIPLPIGLEKIPIEYTRYDPNAGIVEVALKSVGTFGRSIGIVGTTRGELFIDEIPADITFPVAGVQEIVVISDVPVAIVSETSAITENTYVFDACIPYQFGTDAWRDCEVMYGR